MTTSFRSYVFTTSTVPATGPQGAGGTLRSVLLGNFLSSVIEAYVPRKGMEAFVAPAEPSGHTTGAAAAGLRHGRKGVDGEELGRGTIDLTHDKRDHVCAALLLQRNVVPSIHIRCRMTASLRATATFARLRPRRLATSSPQRLSAEKRVTRDSKTFAAS